MCLLTILHQCIEAVQCKHSLLVILTENKKFNLRFDSRQRRTGHPQSKILATPMGRYTALCNKTTCIPSLFIPRYVSVICYVQETCVLKGWKKELTEKETWRSEEIMDSWWQGYGHEEQWQEVGKRHATTQKTGTRSHLRHSAIRMQTRRERCIFLITVNRASLSRYSRAPCVQNLIILHHNTSLRAVA